MALLLPGLLLVSNLPTASAAAPTIGRVTVSGSDILVDGVKPVHPFFGVADTTVIAFAIENYINGNHGVAGWSSVFNGPDTGSRIPVTPNDTPDAFWNQYFAQMASLDVNLVRIGPHDIWGSGISYNAWQNHRDQYFDLLHSMAYYAQVHGVWLSFVMGGSQEYPAFQWGGSGTVFEPGSSAFNGYLAYARSVMVELEKENSIAMYDMFNEPDHDKVSDAYWQGDKVRFNAWANAIADATAGVSTHPRNMGIAGFGKMFGMNQADFNLATGDTRFEILHRHYYASNTDPYNFEGPEQWAKEKGKPLYWGELAWNGQYPLVRYDFAEKTIWNAGGQAIAAMVLTGTPRYPYYGGVTGQGQVPMLAVWPEPTPTPTPAPTPGTSNVVKDPTSSVAIKATAAAGGYNFTYTTDMSSDKIASVHWDFGDGNVSNEAAPNHSFATGEYRVTISLTAKNGTVLKNTYAVNGTDAARSGNASVDGSNRSIAGAIAWGSSDSILMVVALVSASVIGLIGYMAMVRGFEFPFAKFRLKK